MKNEVLFFFIKYKSKKLRCRLLQFLFGALRINVVLHNRMLNLLAMLDLKPWLNKTETELLLPFVCCVPCFQKTIHLRNELAKLMNPEGGGHKKVTLCTLLIFARPCSRCAYLVGCFGFNGTLRQCFSLHQVVSQTEGERREK